ncbi:MAG: hypothetical protein MJY88_08115 [Bacteroidales bacterium]|nr:hypothetical protein [Bacteroidales bacterium]
MTVGDLYNMFLRLVMAAKEDESEFRFDTGVEGAEPLGITAVDLDEDGDVRLECDSRCPVCMGAIELASELRKYDGCKTVYFVYIGADGSRDIYNIKDGGTRDRQNPELRMIRASELADLLCGQDKDSIPYFESGTVNFTVNSVYMDEQDCLCLESNEIEELDNYTSGLLVEELSQVDADTRVYLYDDDSKEYYGIYVNEHRTDPDGNPWINVR